MTIVKTGKRSCDNNAPLNIPYTNEKDWNNANATDKYLVYSEIFFLPSSPDFCISSSDGIATVKSCITIDDVMYGVTPRANNVNWLNAPPDIISYNESTLLLLS